jgi:hypothetical protein
MQIAFLLDARCRSNEKTKSYAYSCQQSFKLAALKFVQNKKKRCAISFNNLIIGFIAAKVSYLLIGMLFQHFITAYPAQLGSVEQQNDLVKVFGLSFEQKVMPFSFFYLSNVNFLWFSIFLTSGSNQIKKNMKSEEQYGPNFKINTRQFQA